MNAQRLELIVQRFAQALDGELGGAVHAETSGRAVATNRRQIDHASGTLGTHVWQHGPGDIKQPEHVGVEQATYVFQAHRCSGYRQANTGQLAPWEFKVGNEKIYRDFAPVLCSNDMDTEVQAVLSGLMVGQLGSFAATQHIRSGRLVPLLLQHLAELDGIYLYYGHRTELPLRVRTFIDFVVERMGNNPAFFLQPQELRAEHL
jgi:hypothetical protein